MRGRLPKAANLSGCLAESKTHPALIETPEENGNHSQPLQPPKNDFAVHDFAKTPGAYGDAATGQAGPL